MTVHATLISRIDAMLNLEYNGDSSQIPPWFKHHVYARILAEFEKAAFNPDLFDSFYPRVELTSEEREQLNCFSRSECALFVASPREIFYACSAPTLTYFPGEMVTSSSSGYMQPYHGSSEPIGIAVSSSDSYVAIDLSMIGEQLCRSCRFNDQQSICDECLKSELPHSHYVDKNMILEQDVVTGNRVVALENTDLIL